MERCNKIAEKQFNFTMRELNFLSESLLLHYIVSIIFLIRSSSAKFFL